MSRNPNPHIQIKDGFKPLPEYALAPHEIVAIGLLIGKKKMDKARKLAKDRLIGEFAVIGNAGIWLEAHPPEDARPPEPWMHEFIKPKYLAQAIAIAYESMQESEAMQQLRKLVPPSALDPNVN